MKPKSNGEAKPNFVPSHPSGKVFHQASDEEVEARVLRVEGWLLKGIFVRSKLKALIKKHFNLEWRMADEVIRRARQRLLVHLEDTRQNHRCSAYGFYAGVVANQKATISERIAAQTRLDKLLGLDDPVQVKHEITVHPRGVSVDDLDMATKKALLTSIRERNRLIGEGDGKDRGD